MRSSIKTRSATSSRSVLASFLMTNANSRMCVWGAVVRSLTMTAGVSLRKSTEPHHRLSLRTVPAVPSPTPVSPVTPLVKPEGGQRRVLLLTSETAFGG